MCKFVRQLKFKKPNIPGYPKKDNQCKVKPDNKCLLYFLRENGGGVKKMNDFSDYQ